jgi:hypothetical protein
MKLTTKNGKLTPTGKVVGGAVVVAGVAWFVWLGQWAKRPVVPSAPPGSGT